MIIMSNYRIYAGSKKALVFPIMGDGYVHLDYSKHIPKGADGTQSNSGIEVDEPDDDDDAKYGLWGHTGSFTIEGIITPYDVNGFGYRLGTDYDGIGIPSLSAIHTSGLEIPFTNKYYSPMGQSVTGTDSRTQAYFSHMPIAYSVTALTTNSGTGLGEINPANNQTEFAVSNVEDIVGGTNIRIDNEQMEVVSVSHSKGIGTRVVVTRGQNGTIATSHSANSIIYGDNRLNHKMSIFHNETCEFYLKNMTRTTMNQPAEYKLGCVLKGKDNSGNIRTVTVESTVPVITADNEYFGRTVEQTKGADEVFGKPVYFNSEDRVRYHKKVDTSDRQIYIERYYDAPFLSSSTSGSVLTSTVFGQESLLSTGDGNFIQLVDAGVATNVFPATIVDGTYIKIIGSPTNDGYYQVKTRHSGTKIELEPDSSRPNTAILTGEQVANNANCAIHHQVNTFQNTFSNGHGAFYTRLTTSANTSNLDMTPHLWMGSNVYSQASSTGTFSTSLEQTTPKYLGWIGDINVTTGNKTDIVSLAKCKLTRPIRTTSENMIYVDDTRYLSVGDFVWNSGERMQIERIAKDNSIRVRRGSAKTTSLDAYGLTGATNSNYLIHPNEEYNFSRTLYAETSNIYENMEVDLADSDEYGAHFLGDTWKEASYVLRPFHLAMAYDTVANRISLFVDGKEVDTQTFSEGNLRISSYSGTGEPKITTIDPHELAVNDWVKIENSTVTNLDGVWKVQQITSDYTFIIICPNGATGTLGTSATLTDVTTRTNNPIDTFEFDATDCYLGSNGNDTLETRRPSQFMGEMHEFAITKDYKDQFNSIDTLVPNFRKTLVYFRFEGDN